MFSVKQIFLILSVISLASAAEKGVSARKSNAELQATRGLKKSSSKKSGSGSGSSGGFVAPNRGGAGGIVGGSVGGVGGVNRDGTTPGQLLQPAGKACVPFEDAQKWLSTAYPGDTQCRTANGDGGVTSACCRVFSFSDTNGPQKWLLYDANNQYRDLMCVCGANTGTGASTGTPVIGVPATPPTADRDGGVVGNPVAAPVAPPVAAPVSIPATPPGTSVCANPNPTQLELQAKPGIQGCVSSSECGSNKCCSSDSCICYPTNFLGNAYCT